MKLDLQSEQLVEGVGMGAGASCSEHGHPSGAEMLEVLSGGRIPGENLERTWRGLETEAWVSRYRRVRAREPVRLWDEEETLEERGGGGVSGGGRGQGSLALGAPGTTEGGRGRAGGP